jgi:hypothetical protein
MYAINGGWLVDHVPPRFIEFPEGRSYLPDVELAGLRAEMLADSRRLRRQSDVDFWVGPPGVGPLGIGPTTGLKDTTTLWWGKFRVSGLKFKVRRNDFDRLS